MKIGIDARFYAEAGPGRYVKNIIEHLEKINQINEYIKRRIQSHTSSSAANTGFFGQQRNDTITQRKVAEARKLIGEIRTAGDVTDCITALEGSINSNKEIVSWTRFRQGDFKMVLDHCIAQCIKLNRNRSQVYR